MSVLNKPEVVAAIAKETGETKAAVLRVLDSFERVVTEEVADGGEVRISGFVKFSKYVRKSRKVVNPQTREETIIPATPAVRVTVLTRFKRIFDSSR